MSDSGDERRCSSSRIKSGLHGMTAAARSSHEGSSSAVHVPILADDCGAVESLCASGPSVVAGEAFPVHEVLPWRGDDAPAFMTCLRCLLKRSHEVRCVLEARNLELQRLAAGIKELRSQRAALLGQLAAAETSLQSFRDVLLIEGVDLVNFAAMSQEQAAAFELEPFLIH